MPRTAEIPKTLPPSNGYTEIREIKSPGQRWGWQPERKERRRLNYYTAVR